MKFYYSTNTGATLTRIVLEELGLKHSAIEVSWSQNKNVEELESVNPLGAVPVLVTDSGEVITQNLAILEYLADQKPSAKMLAEPGSVKRAQILSWVSFGVSDFQKAFTPIFRAEEWAASEEAQQPLLKYGRAQIGGYLKHINQSLEAKTYIVGEDFTIADVCLFMMIGWCNWFEISFQEYKNIVHYMNRIFERPAVQKILKDEDFLEIRG